MLCFFFSSRRRHTRWPRDWSSDVCSSDLIVATEHSPSIYVLQDPSLPSNEPTAHELLSAIHPNAVLSYESALRAHQLKIGRASCRERGEIPVVGAVLNKEDVRRRHERDRR